jgi:hypothetical protein
MKPEVIFPSRTIILFTCINFLLIITYVFIFPLILLLTLPNIMTPGITFIYQSCAFLVGIVLIDKENKKSKRLKINLEPSYEEISALKE